MIRLWDCRDEYIQEREDILAAVDQVFSSGQLILGDSVKRFEKAFAEYCGVRHGVGVDNCTNGLTLVLRALGIGEGDEVITVANTAVPTIAAIVAAGARPRFVDIEPGSYLMDVSLVARALTPNTACVIAVHLYGQCVEMRRLSDLCSDRGLHLVEDCAQSHGATQHGMKCGSLSKAGVFSFYPTKPLGAYGDGGLIVTDDCELASKLRVLRFYGMRGEHYAEEHGFNSRLDEVQAEILNRKLARLEQYLTDRRAVASRYAEALGRTSVELPVEVPGNRHVYYNYVCRHPDRDRIVLEMRNRQVELAVNYRWPIHLMPPYRHFTNSGTLPETERAAREIFSLPLYPSLSRAKQDTVCDAMCEVLGVGRGT